MKIAIINGPNLNLLGKREPEIYGADTAESCMDMLATEFPGVELSYFQSNSEGGIIDEIQRVGFGEVDGIVLNAGAYTHYSIAIADAIRAIKVPVVEVHISNVHAREEYRHTSVIASACKGVIAGFGMRSYALAVQALTY